MAAVAQLLVQLDADQRDLERGLRDARRRVGQFDQQVSRDLNGLQRRFDTFGRGVSRALGAAGIAVGTSALASGIQRVITSAAQLGDTAEQIDIGAEALQRLRFAAEQSGSSAADLDDALRRLNRRAGLFAQDGGGPAADAIERLGISVRDAGGAVRSTEDIFFDTVRALQDVQSNAERAALASQLFGEDAGPRLVQLLAQGEDGIRSIGREASVLSDQMVKDAQEIDAEWKELKDTLGTEFARAVLFVADAVGDLRREIEALEDAITGGRLIETIDRITKFQNEFLGFGVLNDIGDRFGVGVSQNAQQRAIAANRAAGDALAGLNGATGDAPARIRETTEATEESTEAADDQTRAFEQLIQRYAKGQEVAREFGRTQRAVARETERGGQVFDGFGRDVESSLVRAITSMEDFRSTFAGLVQDIYRALARRAISGLVGSLFDTALGGLSGILTPSPIDIRPSNPLPIPGRATGGPVTAGQGYLVGERGPELFTPGRSGFVTPNGGIGGATVVNHIDARGADIGVEARIERALARATPQIVRAATAHTVDQRRRNPSLFR